MNKELFIEELKKLNIKVTNEQLKQLDIYYQLLIEENKKYNLTAITDEQNVYLKHFYDSLTIVKCVSLTNQYICDIGTGAGFPGMVLKIMYPNIKLDLLDATAKKCTFLNLVVSKLNLKNVRIINARCEDYAKEVREKYDLVTSRAVAPLKHLLEYSIPLLKVGGSFISLKSNIDKEMENIENYYQKLSLINEKIIKFKLPIENSDRSIYIIKKNAKTQNIYPRTYNQIKKKDI